MPVAYAQANKPIDRPELKTFIADMAVKHRFKQDELHHLFSQMEFKPDIIEKITRPAEALPWHRYQRIFIQEERIQQGLEFWRENTALLAKAEQRYGVPPEIIVGILGVETRYGRTQGNYRVADALATLAFDFPRRGEFFRKELEHFLLLARDEALDPLSLLGSYAGAMGKPQFMPSSYRQYAVDFDGDGKRDLLDNTADAIGSVANYLKVHGWRRGEAVVYPAKVVGDRYKALVAKGLKPDVQLARFGEYDVKPQIKTPSVAAGALIELQTENGYEYWIGLNNFYAITRYNHSPLYAMAVHQLGQEIRRRYDAPKDVADRE